MFFYKNLLKGKKSQKKEYSYDLLGNNQKSEKDDNVLKYSEPKVIFNYINEDGALRAGYGFENLCMPTSKSDLESETQISVRGNAVRGLWQIKWYDSTTSHTDKYYLFYFNDENLICYDNILDNRYITLIVNNTFTEVPTATYYRHDSEDSLLLSGEGSNLMLISGGGVSQSENNKKIVSCCTHYGKLFAITREKRGNLIYTENTNILSWTTEGLEDLDFGDGRGNLNKIISFDDYLFLFRDFGITKVSIYGNDEFSISHMYFSDSYIYPNSIVQDGDYVYFLTKSGLKVFNGSSVKDVNIDCMSYVNACENSNCSATCFEGKYFLACRGDFGDDEVIGCEGFENGYINNMLLVYDISNGHTEITRGVDIHQLLALNNPFKSKLIACFNNEHIGKIGQLTKDGQLFGESLKGLISFARTDFGKPDVKKRIRSILIKSDKNCSVFIENEDKTYEFSISGKNKIQKIRANILGKSFGVRIEAEDNETKINKFVLQVEEWLFFIKII